jgi:glycosyltransferase involved in cell wall biosynthesis
VNIGPDIRVSVALVTRQRPESLRRCLESLRAQEGQPFEVVVSDDSEAAEAGATREVAGRFGCRYVTGPRRGLYANRNAAALACTGTHVRTMDDDHTLPAGHWARCTEAVARDPGAIWTTGEVGFVDGRLHARMERAAQLDPTGLGGPVNDPEDNWAIADGSTIYPAAVFARGLRMVEVFGYGSSYLEFGAFFYRHGFRSRCVPGALVEHHAEAAILGRSNPASRLFASWCYNCYFQPDMTRALRHAAVIFLRWPQGLGRWPGLMKLARRRWLGQSG